MNVCSFFAPRPEHPFYRDYTPFLNLLRQSCERFGHRHIVLTDDPAVGEDAYVTPLPRSLMRATIAAQLAYLDDPQFADVPTLFTGADCVLAQDPAMVDTRGVYMVVTVDDRFLDCRMNCGAMFIPVPKAVRWIWREALARCGDDWGDDQTSLWSVITDSKPVWSSIREIPCDPYNLAPEHPGDDCRRGVVLHFRGARKNWMVDYCHKWLGFGDGITAVALPNVSEAEILENVRINSRRELPWIQNIAAHDRHAVLVGGGPSLADSLDEIRQRQADGQIIFGLNGAASYLLERGIRADFGVILDSRPENVRFLCETRGGWLIASRVSPAIFDAAGDDATMWHFAESGILEMLPEERRQYATLMTGGIVVGLTAMSLAFAMGFRFLHLFGYDSSDREDAAHAYDQSETDAESKRVEVWLGERKFRCGIAMYAQAQAFEPWANLLAEQGATITVHGDGLLPAIAQEMQRAAMAQETK